MARPLPCSVTVAEIVTTPGLCGIGLGVALILLIVGAVASTLRLNVASGPQKPAVFFARTRAMCCPSPTAFQVLVGAVVVTVSVAFASLAKL